MDEQVVDYGEEIFRVGNWVLTDKYLYFEDKRPLNPIARERIWEVQKNQDIYIYPLPIELVSKSWQTKEDIFQFNTLFFFALDYFKGQKPNNSKSASIWGTLLVQKNELGFKEEKFNL